MDVFNPENEQKKGIFWTPYPPLLVLVVIERPQVEIKERLGKEQGSAVCPDNK